MSPPPEAVEATALVFRDGVVMLAAALVFVTLFRRLGLGAVLGYLVAGAALGGHGLGLVSGGESIVHIAELGIVLLLFLVGLELNPTRLWRLRRDIFGVGLAQVVVAGIVLAAFLYAVTGVTIAAALALGLPLALSSTAQVLPSLRDELHTPSGERAFSILLFQDLSIVPLITVIAALSRAPPDPAAPPGWQLALLTVAAIVGLVLAGRFLIAPLFRIVGRVSERELFVVAALFTVLASAAVMESLHLSTALGAFIAGVMLADSPYRHEIELDIEPFRSLLLGMFFIGVGMLLDLDAVMERPWFVLGMAAALIALKTGVLFGIARLFGASSREALKTGLLLSQGGEFAFVLFAQAQGALLVTGEAASLFAAVVTLSMATTPFLMMFNDRLDRRAQLRDGDGLDGPEHSPETSAIVVGYGRFGQTVAQMLMAQGVAITAIDLKARQIELSQTFGMKVYYGDGTRLDLLRQAGADRAAVILFCLDGRTLSAKKLEPILEAFPQAAVLARVFDRLHLIELDGLDFAGACREVFESAVRMGRAALVALGVGEDEAERIETEYRRRDALRLGAQSQSGDMHSLQHLIFHPDRPMGSGDPQP